MAIGVHGADGGYAPHAVGEVRYCVEVALGLLLGMSVADQVRSVCCGPGLRGKTYTMDSLSRRLSAFARSSGRIATVV